MTATALITGGAGFIGTHVAQELLAAGFHVRVLDSLDPQVHPERARPGALPGDVELLAGDVRDDEAVRRAVRGAEVVVHLAARVGVAQSMVEIGDYAAVNTHGTGVLLQALLEHPVRRLVVASSMSVYGEGAYVDGTGAPVPVAGRTEDRLSRAEWEPAGPAGEPVSPVPTSELAPVAPASMYALGKHDQERMCLLFGSAFGVPTVALRLFNVYGPHQALSNPYTGVLAIFAARLLNGRPPLLFEDGRQRRDFVHVRDAARAFRLAIERPEAGGAINVGSGESLTVVEVAVQLAAALGTPIAPEATGRYRVGDVRHCFADIGRAERVLGLSPRVAFADGVAELATWLAGQTADDRVEHAMAELAAAVR